MNINKFVLVGLILCTAMTVSSRPANFVGGQVYWDHTGNLLNFDVVVNLRDSNCNIIKTGIANGSWQGYANFGFTTDDLADGTYYLEVPTFTAGTAKYKSCMLEVQIVNYGFHPGNDLYVGSLVCPYPCSPLSSK